MLDSCVSLCYTPFEALLDDLYESKGFVQKVILLSIRQSIVLNLGIRYQILDGIRWRLAGVSVLQYRLEKLVAIYFPRRSRQAFVLDSFLCLRFVGDDVDGCCPIVRFFSSVISA